MATINIKRVYEPADDSDGFRVLVDRLWPRGVSKQNAAVGLWLKEVGPSNELRTWFGHIPERYGEFKKRYFEELEKNTEPINQIKEILSNNKVVTLVYSAKDIEHNQAVVLKQYLDGTS